MTKAILMVAMCAALLCAEAALAAPGQQQICDDARITAWRVYQSCVDAVAAKEAKGVTFDDFKAFWRCRHAYFKKWTTFQSKASLAGSTCIGSQLTDNGTTVTDNLTELVWEKKTTDGSIHNVANTYSWGLTGSPFRETGTVFINFLAGPVTGLNIAGFAGSNGWRLPTLAELQSALNDFTCRGTGGSPTCVCGSSPCIDGTFGPTQAYYYWSATIDAPFPLSAWEVFFGTGLVDTASKPFTVGVRAVRGGFQ